MRKITLAALAVVVLVAVAEADVKSTLRAIDADNAGDYAKAESLFLMSCGAKKINHESLVFSRKLNLSDIPAILELSNGIGDGPDRIFSLTIGLKNLDRVEKDIFSKISTPADLENSFLKFKNIYSLEAIAKTGYQHPAEAREFAFRAFNSLLYFIAGKYSRDHNEAKAGLYYAAACQFAIDEYISEHGVSDCHDAAIYIANNFKVNEVVVWAVVRGFYIDKLFHGEASKSNRDFFRMVKEDPETLPVARNAEDELKKISFGGKNIFLPLIEDGK